MPRSAVDFPSSTTCFARPLSLDERDEMIALGVIARNGDLLRPPSTMGARANLWPPERLAAMSVFFSQVGYKYTQEWKEDIVCFDSNKTSAGSAAGSPWTATLPDGTTAHILPDQDPREVFAA